MNLLKIFSALQKRIIDPKIYAVVLELDDRRSLYLGAHYSLEDAYGAAKEEHKFPKAKLLMWTIENVHVLLRKVSEDEMTEIKDDVGIKNKLMKKIADSKSVKLLEASKKKLTAEEYDYLADKLKS